MLKSYYLLKGLTNKTTNPTFEQTRLKTTAYIKMMIIVVY